jgi:predicted porin
MKKAVMISVLAVVSGMAQAQSSVTLYGVFDDGIDYVSNSKGKPLVSMVSGEINGARWGLKGEEDLGGGYKAVFQLENGFDSNTGTLGQGGLEFGRMALVGLSTPYGAVTAGRQYSSIIDFVGATLTASESWGGWFATHPGDLDQLNNTFRVNSSVKYMSVDYRGFKFGAMYNFGGQAGDFNRFSGVGGGFSYANGPLALGAAYQSLQDPYISAYNNGANAAAALQSPVFSGYASARTLQIIVAGAAYRIGQATLGATYSNTQYQQLGADPGNAGATPHLSGTAIFNNFEVSIKYLLTPSFQVAASYNFTNGSSVGSLRGAKYNQFAIGTDYFLSKRIDLMFVAGYQKASGVDSTGHQAVAAIDQLSPSSNNHQAAVRFAIRHRF